MSQWPKILSWSHNPFFHTTTMFGTVPKARKNGGNFQIMSKNYKAFFLSKLKLAPFQKVQCVCQISKINIPNHFPELKIQISCLLVWAGKSNLQNNDSKSLSWTWNLNFLPKTINNLFKSQAQDSDLEYLFWRLKKLITLSEKKPPLVRTDSSKDLDRPKTIRRGFF